MHQAVFDGNLEHLRSLGRAAIQAYPTTAATLRIGNLLFPAGTTLLHVAAVSLRAETVIPFLVQSGVKNVSVADCSGRAPLHCAASIDRGCIASLLLEHGAPVNQPAKNGQTPLHVAAAHNNAEVAEVLLCAGASLEAGDSTGMLPIHAAAKHGGSAVLDVLVRHGADVNSAYTGGWVPLLLAAGNPREQQDCVVAYLLHHGASALASSDFGWTALHFSAIAADAKTARLLLDHGADPGARLHDGSTPLHIAAGKVQSAPFIDVILNANRADPLQLVNEEKQSGQTPLHISASTKGAAPVVRCLLAHGAHPDGAAAIAWSQQFPDPDVIVALLPHSCATPSLMEKVNSVTFSNGLPLLFHVVASKDLAALRVLLVAGADTSIRGNGATLLDFVVKHEQEEVILMILMRSPAPVSRQFLERHALGKSLLDAVARVIPYGTCDERAFVVEAAQFLIRNGISPCEEHLSSAIDGGRPELVLALCHSAEELPRCLVNKRIGGLPLLHHASMAGDVRVIDLLLRAGANIFGMDSERRTACDIAASRAHAEAVLRLKQAETSAGRLDTSRAWHFINLLREVDRQLSCIADRHSQLFAILQSVPSLRHIEQLLHEATGIAALCEKFRKRHCDAPHIRLIPVHTELRSVDNELKARLSACSDADVADLISRRDALRMKLQRLAPSDVQLLHPPLGIISQVCQLRGGVMKLSDDGSADRLAALMAHPGIGCAVEVILAQLSDLVSEMNCARDTIKGPESCAVNDIEAIEVLCNFNGRYTAIMSDAEEAFSGIVLENAVIEEKKQQEQAEECIAHATLWSDICELVTTLREWSITESHRIAQDIDEVKDVQAKFDAARVYHKHLVEELSLAKLTGQCTNNLQSRIAAMQEEKQHYRRELRLHLCRMDYLVTHWFPEYVEVFKRDLVITSVPKFDPLLSLSDFGGASQAHERTMQARSPDGRTIVILKHCRDLKALAREARGMNRVCSPFIVPLLHTFIDRVPHGCASFYLVTPKYEGGHLDVWLKRQKQEGDTLAGTLARVIAQVCEGLAAVHRAGLVHADIKSANIVMSSAASDAVPKIIDFDANVAVERRTTELLNGASSTLEIRGTLDFVAPEIKEAVRQGAHQKDLRHLSQPPIDIYALGTMLLGILNDVEISDAAQAAFRKLIATMRIADPAARPTADQVVSQFRALPFSHICSAQALQLPAHSPTHLCVCSYCLDDVNDDSAGVSCSPSTRIGELGEVHTVCRRCLRTAVTQWANMPLETHMDRGGTLFCAYDGCGGSIDLPPVLSLAPELKDMMTRITKRVADQQTILALELSRKKRHSLEHAINTIENILKLECPRCRSSPPRAALCKGAVIACSCGCRYCVGCAAEAPEDVSPLHDPRCVRAIANSANHDGDRAPVDEAAWRRAWYSLHEERIEAFLGSLDESVATHVRLHNHLHWKQGSFCFPAK